MKKWKKGDDEQIKQFNEIQDPIHPILLSNWLKEARDKRNYMKRPGAREIISKGGNA